MSLLQGSDPSGGYVMGILLGKGLPMPLLQEAVLREGHVTEMLLRKGLLMALLQASFIAPRDRSEDGSVNLS